MLFATATTVLVVAATLIAAIPFVHADRQQRRRSRARPSTDTRPQGLLNRDSSRGPAECDLLGTLSQDVAREKRKNHRNQRIA